MGGAWEADREGTGRIDPSIDESLVGPPLGTWLGDD